MLHCYTEYVHSTLLLNQWMNQTKGWCARVQKIVNYWGTCAYYTEITYSMPTSLVPFYRRIITLLTLFIPRLNVLFTSFYPYLFTSCYRHNDRIRPCTGFDTFPIFYYYIESVLKPIAMLPCQLSLFCLLYFRDRQRSLIMDGVCRVIESVCLLEQSRSYSPSTDDGCPGTPFSFC